MFIRAVYGILYRSVYLGTGGLCSPSCRGEGVAEVSGGGLRCCGLFVFAIKSLHTLWVFSVVVRLGSGNGCVV